MYLEVSQHDSPASFVHFCFFKCNLKKKEIIYTQLINLILASVHWYLVIEPFGPNNV